MQVPQPLRVRRPADGGFKARYSTVEYSTVQYSTSGMYRAARIIAPKKAASVTRMSHTCRYSIYSTPVYHSRSVVAVALLFVPSFDDGGVEVHGTGRYGTVRRGTVRYCTIRYGTVRYDTAQ